MRFPYVRQGDIGGTIRVRGWIERRNGPLIRVTSLLEIEILDDVEE